MRACSLGLMTIGVVLFFVSCIADPRTTTPRWKRTLIISRASAVGGFFLFLIAYEILDLKELIELIVLVALIGSLRLGFKYRSTPQGSAIAGTAAACLVLAGPMILDELTIMRHYRIMFSKPYQGDFGRPAADALQPENSD